jgi:hypothetical protein
MLGCNSRGSIVSGVSTQFFATWSVHRLQLEQLFGCNCNDALVATRQERQVIATSDNFLIVSRNYQ